MFFVYILFLDKTNQFYKGLTSNLERRLNDHSKNKVKTTKNKGPINLVHVELCKTRNEARKLEKYFKSGYGREIISEVTGYK